MSALGKDCTYFLISTCKKGDSCPYRHSEAAKTTHKTCKYWESGNCTNTRCTYRHSYATYTTSEVECYWEKQPTGCTKENCTFKHTKRPPKESGSHFSYQTLKEAALIKGAQARRCNEMTRDAQQMQIATAISSEFTCPICLELFEDLVTLACRHSYCRHCLETILKSSGFDKFRCPECRYEAISSNEDLQNLPRNFTLAKIVAEYENVEESNIPCDVCKEEPPSRALKSCKECKMSYCEQCLYPHAMKSIFATHCLVEPQKFECRNQQESFCIKCVLVLNVFDDKEYCLQDHPSDIVDIERAKSIMMGELQEAYARLEDRKEKYRKDVQATSEVLNNLKISTEETKTKLNDEMKRKYESDVERKRSDFHDQVEKAHRLNEEETHKIQTEIEQWTKEFEDRNRQNLFHLNQAYEDISGILPDLQNIFKASEKDLDIKDIMKIYGSVIVVQNKEFPRAFVREDFNLAERLKKVKVAQSSNSKEKILTSPEGRVIILSCKLNQRKKEEGASVTVTWSSSAQGGIFEMKFVEAIHDNIRNTITISGIKGVAYTETRLQHDTKYDVTVSVIGNLLSESECVRLSTLPGVSCEEFQFSSAVRHNNIDLSWDNKNVSSRKDGENKHQEFPAMAFRKATAACGTLVLRNSSRYWESVVTYHLRGVRKFSYVIAIGICANSKMDDNTRLGTNRYFYGVTFSKNEGGASEICCVNAGIATIHWHMECARYYNERIGFYFDARQPQLVVVDVNTDEILHETGKLNISGGMELEYYPVCDLSKEGDANIKLITGRDIKQIPSCIKNVLQ